MNAVLNPLRIVILGAALATLAGAHAAFAAGDHPERHGHEHASPLDFGEPGNRAAVTRTIEVTMADNHFQPENITVEAGETVRFVVNNDGNFLHEFNIGTAAMHADHQEEMATMMEHGMITANEINHEMMAMDHSADGMAGHVHDDPNSVLVEPGQSAELIWTFTTKNELEFACNVPGHYEAGMTGEIRIQD